MDPEGLEVSEAESRPSFTDAARAIDVLIDYADGRWYMYVIYIIMFVAFAISAVKTSARIARWVFVLTYVLVALLKKLCDGELPVPQVAPGPPEEGLNVPPPRPPAPFLTHSPEPSAPIPIEDATEEGTQFYSLSPARSVYFSAPGSPV